MITRSEIHKNQEYLIKLNARMGMFLILCVVNISFVFVFRNNPEWIDVLNDHGHSVLGTIVYYSIYPLFVFIAITSLVKIWIFNQLRRNQKMLQMKPMDLHAMQVEKSKGIISLNPSGDINAANRQLKSLKISMVLMLLSTPVVAGIGYYISRYAAEIEALHSGTVKAAVLESFSLVFYGLSIFLFILFLFFFVNFNLWKRHLMKLNSNLES